MEKRLKIMVILTEKFKFIKDNIFLCPFVDTDTGKQQFILQKINSKTKEVEFEDSIDCIHTEINSSLKEKFFVLKSRTARIAEAGYESFKFQTEIDNVLDLAYPMTNLLLKFMLRVDPVFLETFLTKLDNDCRYIREKNNPSYRLPIPNYIAEVLNVFKIVRTKTRFQTYDIDTLSIILENILKHIFVTKSKKPFSEIVIEELIKYLRSNQFKDLKIFIMEGEEFSGEFTMEMVDYALVSIVEDYGGYKYTTLSKFVVEWGQVSHKLTGTYLSQINVIYHRLNTDEFFAYLNNNNNSNNN